MAGDLETKCDAARAAEIDLLRRILSWIGENWDAEDIKRFLRDMLKITEGVKHD